VLRYPLNPQLTTNMLPINVLCYLSNSQLTGNRLPIIVLCYLPNPQLTGNMLLKTVLCYLLKPQLSGIKLSMTKCYITTKTFQMEKSLLMLPLEKLVEAFIFLFAYLYYACVYV
jgi:hypothetical protein